LSENFVLVGTFWSRNANVGAENPILGKFKGKIEIPSRHNLDFGNLQLHVGTNTMQLPALPSVFNPRRSLTTTTKQSYWPTEQHCCIERGLMPQISYCWMRRFHTNEGIKETYGPKKSLFNRYQLV